MNDLELSDETPVDPDDELLVAYLDGELARDERNEVERRLIAEDQLRVRLQQLQHGWDLLGELDHPASSHKLVESTLELAASNIAASSPSARGGWSPLLRGPLGVGLACLVGIVVMFAAASLRNARRYRLQLKDLAIVENLDAYLHGGDMQLIRQLMNDSEWQQVIDASNEITQAMERTFESISAVSSSQVSDREAVIVDLPLHRRAELKSRWERFKRLSPDDQQRIREIADLVASQADSDELLHTMAAYAVWQENIQPMELREQINSSDPQVRRTAIAQAIKDSQRKIALQSSNMLDEETVEEIYQVLRLIVYRRVDQGGRESKEWFNRIKNTPGVIDPAAEVLAQVVLRAEELGIGRPPPLTPEELEWIRMALPDDAKKTLTGITGGIAMIDALTLQVWAEEAVRRRYRRPNSETALQRYRSLDPTEREILDLLPPEQILERLTE